VNWFKLNCFLGLGVLVLVGGALAIWGLNKGDLRVPASLGEGRVIPELEIVKRRGDVYLQFPEEFNICDDGLEVVLVLEARGVAVLSETDPKIQIQINSSCDRSFAQPIFMESFCTDGLMYEDYERVMYKMINGMGFFPREWTFKKLLIGDEEVSLENQPALSEYIFECE